MIYFHWIWKVQLASIGLVQHEGEFMKDKMFVWTVPFKVKYVISKKVPCQHGLDHLVVPPSSSLSSGSSFWWGRYYTLQLKDRHIDKHCNARALNVKLHYSWKVFSTAKNSNNSASVVRIQVRCADQGNFIYKEFDFDMQIVAKSYIRPHWLYHIIMQTVLLL